MYLGIEQHVGLVYEGSGNPDIPAIPMPTITHAKLIAKPEDLQALPGPSETFGWMFREDSFDAITRTRRGRLYAKKEGTQPDTVHVAPHPYDRPGLKAGVEGSIRKSLYVYMACFELLALPNKGLGATLALGSARAASTWLIVQTEVVFSGAVMVTLKALTAYGIVPELDVDKIAEPFKASVSQAVARVVDSAFQESPGSVVDHCKDAMQVVMSSWLAQHGEPDTIRGEEVADTAAKLEEKPHAKFIAANLGKVAGLLHPRNKTSAKVRRGYRSLLREDAEFALHSLGLTLRELGWAKNMETPTTPAPQSRKTSPAKKVAVPRKSPKPARPATSA